MSTVTPLSSRQPEWGSTIAPRNLPDSGFKPWLWFGLDSLWHGMILRRWFWSLPYSGFKPVPWFRVGLGSLWHGMVLRRTSTPHGWQRPWSIFQESTTSSSFPGASSCLKLPRADQRETVKWSVIIPVPVGRGFLSKCLSKEAIIRTFCLLAAVIALEGCLLLILIDIL